VEIEHAPTSITNERVDETLERMREQQAEFRLVDRVAAPGDLLIVDYTLNIEGQEPTTQTGYAFVIGDGSVMPEIDEAAVGMRAGEQRDVGFRFPDDHRRETLRGKSGTAALKVVEVKEKVLPVLDDDLAKSLGQFEDLAALRAEVQKQLESRQASEDRQALEDKLVDALLGRHPFGVPDSLVMRQIAHQVEHARERMRRQGVDPDRLPWDYEKLIGELRPGAERAVRRALLLEAVAEREQLAPTDAEVDAEVEKIAQAGQRPAPAVRRMMEKSGDLETLRRGLRERMALQFLIDRARIRPAA
jgi:trigger factor